MMLTLLNINCSNNLGIEVGAHVMELSFLLPGKAMKVLEIVGQKRCRNTCVSSFEGLKRGFNGHG